MALMIALLHGTDPDDLGLIPSFLDEEDPRLATAGGLQGAG